MANINANAFLDLIKVSRFEFTAVTTEDGTSNFKKMATSNGKLHLGAAAVVNQDYLEFKVNFKSQAAGVVHLTGLEFGGEEGTFTPDSDSYIQVPSGAKTKHPVTTRAAYGARVSFEVASTTTVYQLENNDLKIEDSAVSGNYFMPIPNDETKTKGVVGGQWSYLTTGLGLEIFAAANGEIISDLTATTIANAYGNETLGTNPTTITLAQVDNEGDYLGSVVVRIWIEGWDVDSYDSIYELLLNVDLTFEKKAPVVNP